MPKSVKDILPYIKPTQEVFLFRDCQCIEHYPYRNSRLIGRTFADVCDLLCVTLPFGCNYAFYRFDNGMTVTLRQFGAYLRIINSKIIFPQNEQNSET